MDFGLGNLPKETGLSFRPIGVSVIIEPLPLRSPSSTSPHLTWTSHTLISRAIIHHIAIAEDKNTACTQILGISEACSLLIHATVGNLVSHSQHYTKHILECDHGKHEEINKHRYQEGSIALAGPIVQHPPDSAHADYRSLLASSLVHFMAHPTHYQLGNIALTILG